MTEVKFKTQPAPSLPEAITTELASQHPLIKLFWNTPDERWEIYVALVDNNHPKNRFTRSTRDRYVNGYWYRLLQTWCERDDRGLDSGYAPIDRRLLRSLTEADTFRTRRFYEEAIEDVEQATLSRAKRDVQEAVVASQQYYASMNTPIISPGSPGRGDWRHKIR